MDDRILHFEFKDYLRYKSLDGHANSYLTGMTNRATDWVARYVDAYLKWFTEASNQMHKAVESHVGTLLAETLTRNDFGCKKGEVDTQAICDSIIKVVSEFGYKINKDKFQDTIIEELEEWIMSIESICHNNKAWYKLRNRVTDTIIMQIENDFDVQHGDINEKDLAYAIACTINHCVISGAQRIIPLSYWLIILHILMEVHMAKIIVLNKKPTIDRGTLFLISEQIKEINKPCGVWFDRLKQRLIHGHASDIWLVIVVRQSDNVMCTWKQCNCVSDRYGAYLAAESQKYKQVDAAQYGESGAAISHCWGDELIISQDVSFIYRMACKLMKNQLWLDTMQKQDFLADACRNEYSNRDVTGALYLSDQLAQHGLIYTNWAARGWVAQEVSSARRLYFYCWNRKFELENISWYDKEMLGIYTGLDDHGIYHVLRGRLWRRTGDILCQQELWVGSNTNDWLDQDWFKHSVLRYGVERVYGKGFCWMPSYCMTGYKTVSHISYQGHKNSGIIKIELQGHTIKKQHLSALSETLSRSQFLKVERTFANADALHKWYVIRAESTTDPNMANYSLVCIRSGRIAHVQDVEFIENWTGKIGEELNSNGCNIERFSFILGNTMMLDEVIKQFEIVVNNNKNLYRVEGDECKENSMIITCYNQDLSLHTSMCCLKNMVLMGQMEYWRYV